MGFVHPELLLLGLPALAVWWRFRDGSRVTQALRLVALLLVVLALAGLHLPRAAEGRDLVVLVDRSRSMPAESGELVGETLRLAAEARGAGDRLAVVGFGRGAAVEWLPDETRTFDTFERPVDADGSDLFEGLETALGLIGEGRRGSVLVISDGEHDGRDPAEAVRQAFAEGVRLDVLPVARPPLFDLAVERIDLPDGVEAGEPFQFSAWVASDAPASFTYTLTRDGRVLSRGTREVGAGRTPLLFRDRLDASGVARYELRLRHDGDRIPENDLGRGAVVARGARPLLVLNDDGQPDTLVDALRGAGLQVEVSAPEALRLDPLTLLSWRAVILENVSAPRLATRGMEALADYVLERGGGLAMTGGKGSFGVGGYHLTPVDPLLPVSMEVRPEHRKQGISLVLVLDRSGSMGAPAGGGTKMDLANQGSLAAIELLTSVDSVAVIAVDSSPHLVLELAPVDGAPETTNRVRAITSGGGGIYVRTGLEAAARVLAASPHQNRHIVLFADAADAEEQQGCVELVQSLPQTTLSVIALGTEADPDAAFLKHLAQQAGGEVYFTDQATELPLLFAQDTLTVARSTFVEDATPVRPTADLFGLGALDLEGFPALGGYNLNYLRDGATAAAVTADEYGAPVLAYRFAGLGRTLAYTGQVGGTFGAPLTAWPGFSALFVTVARWLVGQETPSALFPTVRREGGQALVRVEVDRSGPRPPDTANLVARLRHPDGEYVEYGFERVAEDRYEARIDLRGSGVTLGTLRLPDGGFENLPPIVVPYSPEFEPGLDPAAGERALRELARRTGGEVSPAAHTLFRGDRRAREHRLMTRELALAALLVMLLEIAGRRLGLWSRLPRRASAAVAAEERRWWQRGRRRPEAPEAPEVGERHAGGAPAPRVARPALRTGETEGVTSALDRARRSARSRIDRGSS